MVINLYIYSHENNYIISIKTKKNNNKKNKNTHTQ